MEMGRPCCETAEHQMGYVCFRGCKMSRWFFGCPAYQSGPGKDGFRIDVSIASQSSFSRSLPAASRSAEWSTSQIYPYNCFPNHSLMISGNRTLGRARNLFSSQNIREVDSFLVNQSDDFYLDIVPQRNRF